MKFLLATRSTLVAFFLLLATTAVIISSFTFAVELPRHVSEVISNEELCRVLSGRSPVVAVIVNSLTNPSEQETALLESYAKAAMSFVGDDGVKFVALASDPVATDPSYADAPEISPLVRSWVTRASPVHHKSGNPNGVFIFTRKYGTQSDILWRDWTNATDDIDVPIDALPVDMDEILLAPSAEATAARIVRRVKCMKGPNVRELRTDSDLEDFILNTCHPNGLSIVAWPRKALFPTAQRVPRAKLNMLRHSQQALATVAQLERRFISFGWIDDDAPMLKNSTFLALANGMNAPIISYICDEANCQPARDPFNIDNIQLRVFPFEPFQVLQDVPETQLAEVMQIAVSEYIAEVIEAVEQIPVTGSIEYGINLKDFPREVDHDKVARLQEQHEDTRRQMQAELDKRFELEQQERRAQQQKQKQNDNNEDEDENEDGNRQQQQQPQPIPPTPLDTITHMAVCDDPVSAGESVRALIIGDALSFDPSDSRPVSVSFYRPSSMDKGDVLKIVSSSSSSSSNNAILSKKDLPPQFNILSGEVFGDRLCRDPPTRATIIMRANRHYNVCDLPPDVVPQSTLKFYLEVLPSTNINDDDENADDDENTAAVNGRKEQEDYNSEDDEDEDEQQSQKKQQKQQSQQQDFMHDPKYNFVMTEEDIREGRAPDVEVPEEFKQKNKKNKNKN